MKTFELERGQNGLELYLMAELPSNIIMADEFAKQIDGFQQIFRLRTVLREQGIKSISVTPDSIIKTIKAIALIEK